MIPQLIVASSEREQETYLKKILRDADAAPSALFRIVPEKNDLGIDDVRSATALVLTKTVLPRIIVFSSFETATPEAQNALLKLLEERTEKNQFVLLAKSMQRILPTVMSRVKKVVLDRPATELHPERAAFIQSLVASAESTGYAFLQGASCKEKEEAAALMDDIMLFFRKRLSQTGAPREAAVIKRAMNIKNQLLSANISHQLCVDNLLIFIHKTATMKAGHEKK